LPLIIFAASPPCRWPLHAISSPISLRFFASYAAIAAAARHYFRCDIYDAMLCACRSRGAAAHVARAQQAAARDFAMIFLRRSR
jgi:hypothetical protein